MTTNENQNPYEALSVLAEHIVKHGHNRTLEVSIEGLVRNHVEELKRAAKFGGFGKKIEAVIFNRAVDLENRLNAILG